MSLFTARNYRLFGVGIALLVVGYVLLGQGPVSNVLSKTLSPLILVGTYCVYFPWAILTCDKGTSVEQGNNEGV